MLTVSASPLVAQSANVPIEQRLSPEQMKATGLDALSPAQLKLLNSLLNEEKAMENAAPASSSVIAATAPAATAPIPSAVPAESVAAVGTAPPADRPLLGFNEKPIISRLKGTLTGWDEGTVFELENGQQWKVLKGKMKLPKPLTDPQVKLVPGIVGRWFLQVSEDYPMARVYLIN
jgi:hypothetical protein